MKKRNLERRREKNNLFLFDFAAGSKTDALHLSHGDEQSTLCGSSSVALNQKTYAHLWPCMGPPPPNYETYMCVCISVGTRHQPGHHPWKTYTNPRGLFKNTSKVAFFLRQPPLAPHGKSRIPIHATNVLRHPQTLTSPPVAQTTRTCPPFLHSSPKPVAASSMLLLCFLFFSEQRINGGVCGNLNFPP